MKVRLRGTSLIPSTAATASAAASSVAPGATGAGAGTPQPASQGAARAVKPTTSANWRNSRRDTLPFDIARLLFEINVGEPSNGLLAARATADPAILGTLPVWLQHTSFPLQRPRAKDTLCKCREFAAWRSIGIWNISNSSWYLTYCSTRESGMSTMFLQPLPLVSLEGPTFSFERCSNQKYRTSLCCFGCFLIPPFRNIWSPTN